MISITNPRTGKMVLFSGKGTECLFNERTVLPMLRGDDQDYWTMLICERAGQLARSKLKEQYEYEYEEFLEAEGSSFILSNN